MNQGIAAGLYFAAMVGVSIACVIVFGKPSGQYFAIVGMVIVHAVSVGVKPEIFTNKILRASAAIVVLLALAAGIWLH